MIISEIKAVIQDMLKYNQHQLVFQQLDFYYTKCSCIEDFEIIGDLANQATYYPLSVKCAENVYSLAEDTEQITNARKNLIQSYISNNQPQKAQFYSEQYLRQDPDNFDALFLLAASLKFSGKIKESYQIIDNLYTRTLTQEQKQKLHFSKSYRYLKSGNIALGIDCYLNKKNNSIFDLRKIPKWNGNFQKGKKIYINDGGGIGDQFINMRFYSHLANKGMIPILYSQLERFDVNAIVRRHGFEVITDPIIINQDSCWCNLLELPVILNLTEEELWDGQYLYPTEDSSHQLSPTKKIKIGIKTSGNPYFGQDVYRRVDPYKLIAALPKNVEIYNFDLESKYPNTISLSDSIESWDHTLNYLSQMDVIVSSCTSIAHAASAMNKKTIVLVPVLEYYVWTSSRKDNTTSWYSNNTKLIKQQYPGQWDHELLKLKELIIKSLNKETISG